MSQTDIINKAKEVGDKLRTMIDELTSEISSLEGEIQVKAQRRKAFMDAMAVLEGKEADPAAERIAGTRSLNGMTSADRVWKVIESLPPGATFDKRVLRERLPQFYKEFELSLVDRNLDNAVVTLKKRGKIKLAPGGFQVVTENE